MLRGELDLLGNSLWEDLSCFSLSMAGDSFPISNFFNLEDAGDFINLS